jgi:hypothetical protein
LKGVEYFFYHAAKPLNEELSNISSKCS